MSKPNKVQYYAKRKNTLLVKEKESAWLQKKKGSTNE